MSAVTPRDAMPPKNKRKRLKKGDRNLTKIFETPMDKRPKEGSSSSRASKWCMTIYTNNRRQMVKSVGSLEKTETLQSIFKAKFPDNTPRMSREDAEKFFAENADFIKEASDSFAIDHAKENNRNLYAQTVNGTSRLITISKGNKKKQKNRQDFEDKKKKAAERQARIEEMKSTDEVERLNYIILQVTSTHIHYLFYWGKWPKDCPTFHTSNLLLHIKQRIHHYSSDASVAFNGNHHYWTGPTGTTRARAGVPLDATESASRVSPTGTGSEFDVVDSNGTITARVWYVPASVVLPAAQQNNATGFADVDNAINSQVCSNDQFYNTQATSGDGDAGYIATRQQCYYILFIF